MIKRKKGFLENRYGLNIFFWLYYYVKVKCLMIIIMIIIYMNMFCKIVDFLLYIVCFVCLINVEMFNFLGRGIGIFFYYDIVFI